MFETIKISVTDHEELIELSKTDNLPYAYIRAIERENIAVSIGSRLYVVDIPKSFIRHRLAMGQRYTLEASYFNNVVTLVETDPDHQ
jgi:hypothetical protein